MTITEEILNEIDPGIRKTVAWLNANGFNTTDSGDGTSKLSWTDHLRRPAELADVLDYPHVFMIVAPLAATIEADRLLALISEKRCEVVAKIETSYNPVDRVSVLSLLNVDDNLLFPPELDPKTLEGIFSSCWKNTDEEGCCLGSGHEGECETYGDRTSRLHEVLKDAARVLLDLLETQGRILGHSLCDRTHSLCAECQAVHALANAAGFKLKAELYASLSSEVLTGDDAKRLLEDLQHVASPEEIKKRTEEARIVESIRRRRAIRYARMRALNGKLIESLLRKGDVDKHDRLTAELDRMRRNQRSPSFHRPEN